MQVEITEFENYLRYRYPGRSTLKHYTSDLSIFRQFVGDVSPRTLTSKKISEFVADQSKQGLKAATINRRLSTLSSFFAFLIFESEDDTWHNPIQWQYHSIRPGHHLPRDVSDQAVAQLFAVIDEPRDRAMFTLMIGAGLRVGEVVALQLDDLYALQARHSARLRVHGKGDKERIVWLTAEVVREIQSWLQQRPQVAYAYVFLNQHHRPLSVSGVQFRLKEYCQKAQVSLSCHQLRHTFARRLVENRLPVDTLAKLLGHADLRTTQRYIDGADPSIRDEFLQAMQPLGQAEAVLSEESEPFASAFTRPITEPPPNPATLVDDLAHLAHDLPQWLWQELRCHTMRRLVRWQPHRVKAQTHSHFSTLCRIGRWLVKERHWQQLNQLQRSDLAAYISARSEAGSKPRSLASELTIFRAFWRDLLATEKVTNGAILQVKAPVAGDHLPRSLSGVEFERLEHMVLTETASGSPKDRFNRAWFYLLAHAGLRRSEALNLRLGDCDLSGGRLRVQSGKGDRDRVLPMTPQLIRVVQDYLVIRESAPTNHLLIYKGQAVKAHLLPDRLRAFGKKAQIEMLTTHRLRHTLATFLINQGMPITSLQKFLGHQDINKTLIYARVYDETVRLQFTAAATKIESIAVADWPVHTTPMVVTTDIGACDSV